MNFTCKGHRVNVNFADHVQTLSLPLLLPTLKKYENHSKLDSYTKTGPVPNCACGSEFANSTVTG